METINSFLLENILFTVGAVLISSFLIASSIFPTIIYLSYVKNLTKKPNGRSSHSSSIPTLGGLAIFIGLIITSALVAVLIGNKSEISEILSVFTTSIILLFVGIRDDLMEISSRNKFLTQLVASVLLITLTGHYITDFDGILGLHKISSEFSFPFTIFVYILIINAYNLIDGIDGLATGISIILFGFFGTYLISNNMYTGGLLSIASIGGLIAFLRYNISKTRKVFMGDTGSMIIGHILAYQSVLVIACSSSEQLENQVLNMPIVVLALLSYPLYDTLRVFIIRIREKKSPFSADRNHIHHKFIDLGLTHIQASSFIILYTIIIGFIAIIIEQLDINIQLIIIITTSISLLSIPSLIKTNHRN